MVWVLCVMCAYTALTFVRGACMSETRELLRAAERAESSFQQRGRYYKTIEGKIEGVPEKIVLMEWRA